MSDLRIVNAKFLEERLKRGQRLNDLTDELNTTEEDLISHIYRTFHERTAKNYIKRLKSKKPSNKKKNNTKKNKEDKPEVMESNTEVEINTTGETESKSPKTELELLLEKEKQMSNELCEKEVMHAKIISQRAGLKNKLREQYAQIKELDRKVSEILHDFNANADKLNSLSDEMRALSSHIAEKKSALDALREKIDEAKKITIYVFSSSEIEFENQGSFDPTIDSSRISELFGTLVQNEAAECLTIKNIKQLAKLLAIVEKLKAEGLKFVIEFDENTMKEVFDVSQ